MSRLKVVGTNRDETSVRTNDLEDLFRGVPMRRVNGAAGEAAEKLYSIEVIEFPAGMAIFAADASALRRVNKSFQLLKLPEWIDTWDRFSVVYITAGGECFRGPLTLEAK